ncbi:MAG TPA: alpha-1,4-glucan--maltose-1-phosphate maltosyltransferase [Solimonas sp.]
MTKNRNGSASVVEAINAPRIVIERISPQVDEGRWPAKANLRQAVTVEADIFIDGHAQLSARLVTPQARVPLRFLGNDRWRATIVPLGLGSQRWRIEAWLDRWQGFRNELSKKRDAGLPLQLETQEGFALLQQIAKEPAAKTLASWVAKLQTAQDAVTLLLDEELAKKVAAVDAQPFLSSAEFVVDVERERAGFASWYELFPRSQTSDARRHGTFDDVVARLPAIKAMGFDVLYFPPIHPIGLKHRKGRNNSLGAGADQPGSPYAIGSAEGGHEAVHPELGGIEGFRRLREAAEAQGLELALDFAVQCSPDHPWLTQHPEWFSWRPDGSIRYAENPPKKYEDIVNVEFYAEGATPSLWLALRDVIQGWVDEGVKIFRVDNPHTKPLPFWQWLIADIRSRHPEAIFLSEAFTRPAMMYRLAKIGFQQSYTYFTWRNDKHELTQYLSELTQGPPKDFYRPHFFVNTPDINPHFLQTSGRPGFMIRAALATTLSGLWGMYSGFELCESAALHGKEEYLDSEKYELRPRDWQAPGNIIAEITRLNRIRRENPALQTHLGVKFYNAFNDQVLYFGKATADRSNFILCAISLDPHRVQETQFEVPLWEFGLPDHGVLDVEELMRGSRFSWFGKMQHWRFIPQELPFAIWRVRPRS